MNDAARALLTAHVEHELSRLGGPALRELVRERMRAGFEWLEQVTFDDVATPEFVMGVIDRYVIELQVSGGITELAGEMASVVFSSEASATTRVADICDPKSYDDFADKIGALRGVHHDLVRYVTGSPAFSTLASRVLSGAVVDLVFRKEDRAAFGLGDVISLLGQKLFPHLPGRVEAALARYVEDHAARFTRDGAEHLMQALDPEWIRQLCDEIWQSVSPQPLSDATSMFSVRDLDDFVVLGYEFWLRFRQTPYFRTVVGAVVNRLFSKYGKESVLTLIEDMGVTEEMVANELVTFLGPILDQARSTGFLERELRAHLEPFYESAAVTAILSR